MNWERTKKKIKKKTFEKIAAKPHDVYRSNDKWFLDLKKISDSKDQMWTTNDRFMQSR